jgi:hypothetical protein
MRDGGATWQRLVRGLPVSFQGKGCWSVRRRIPRSSTRASATPRGGTWEPWRCTPKTRTSFTWGYIGPNRFFDGGKTLEDMVVWKENRLLAQSVYDQENGSLIFVDFHAIRYAPVIATTPRYGRMNVFRSRDAGRIWQRITYNLPPNGYAMSLVFDPNAGDGSVIYVTLGGYGFSHLWKLDLGEGKPQAWQDLDGQRLPDVWASGLVVDPADPGSRHLYVATDQGVYRSADGGRSWQPWSEGLYPGVLSVELLLSQPDRLLRLVTHGNGIWQRRLPSREIDR